MAKKKELDISGLMDDFNEDISQTNNKKQSRVGEKPTASPQIKDKGKGSAWRQDERPFRKTVHFDAELNQLINFVANMTNQKIDDIIFDSVKDNIFRLYGKSVEEVMKNIQGKQFK